MRRRFRRMLRIRAHSAENKDRHSLRVALLCTLAAALLLTVTVIIGNRLGERAAKIDPPATDSASDKAETSGNGKKTPTVKTDAAKLPDVNSEYITLSSYAEINWTERAALLKSNGIKAVSLVLYYDGGTVNYFSTAAQKMSYQTATSGKTDLGVALPALAASGIRSDGCFYVTFPAQSSLANVRREYEASLVAEALDAGISDVTLFGFEASDAGVSTADSFMSSVRALSDRSLVGAAITIDSQNAAENALMIAKFAAVFDYVALDLTSVTDADALNGAVASSEGLIKKYNLRIMIPDSIADAGKILNDAGYKNWQVVPK